MMKHCFFSAVILLMISCGSNRALPGEGYLFPAKEAKWWVINSVTRDEKGRAVHFCTLLSVMAIQGRDFAACYSSAWSEAGSVYSYGSRYAPYTSSQAPGNFPVSLLIPGKDSITREWDFSLKRNRLSLEGEMTDMENAAAYFEGVYNFPTIKPFTATLLNAQPVWSTSIIKARLHLKKEKNSMTHGDLALRVFPDQQLLLNKAAGGNVHWADIFLNDGNAISLLFRTDSKGTVTVDGAIIQEKDGHINKFPALAIRSAGRPFFTSRTSGKEYPLSFYIGLPGYDMHLLMQPAKEEQEIPAGRNSFWMGAIELKDSLGSKQYGAGNMYIFKQ